MDDYSHLPSLVNPSTVIGILVGLLFLYYLLRIPKVYRRSPPEAGGAWPIIGHLPLLGGSQPPHITLGQMAEKYGPIFTIRMGVHKTIVVSDWEIAKECFTTNDKVFANRLKAMAPELMGYNYAMFGFSSYGPYWRQVRKIVTQELLSSHRLMMLGHVKESEIKSSVDDINKLCIKNNLGEVKVEMKKWFGDIALNTVFKMVVGKRFVDGENPNEIEMGSGGDEGNNGRCRKAIRDFFDLTGAFVLSDAIPWLRWLDLGGYEKAMKRTAKELDRVMEEWLEEHKRKKDVDSDRDFMSVMLSVLDGAQQFSSYDADTINKATCVAFILGSSDTTAAMLTWALALLLNNREALKKAQQELNEQIGTERRVKESDTKNLVYLQAIVKETLRLYPGFPLLVPHESTEACTLGGYHVSSGTRLMVNASKLQRDPKVWSEPCEFRPERFLTTHQNVDVKGQNFELIPFGSGRRMCPGVSFAVQIMHLTLAALLHGFEIKTPSDQPVDMTGTIGLTHHKSLPLDVLLTPRIPTHLE
ncbi:cytochrome P450 CYP82D47-like [Humulus lupulus]|uniref:cytochrome P450 CYP82D47-like n=1 Tax=Humulus lupulus TaxID=3486 RepID=UPI002B40FF34|nr:cytochrome P450 CYP82D47-like [Humulus lupulus]